MRNAWVSRTETFEITFCETEEQAKFRFGSIGTAEKSKTSKNDDGVQRCSFAADQGVSRLASRSGQQAMRMLAGKAEEKAVRRAAGRTAWPAVMMAAGRSGIMQSGGWHAELTKLAALMLAGQNCSTVCISCNEDGAGRTAKQELRKAAGRSVWKAARMVAVRP